MFIVIDGPDGSGKTSLCNQLTQALLMKNQNAVYTCEPTMDSEAGKALRHMMRSGEVTDAYSFADLFLKDREYHIASWVEPHLLQGDIVICDRYKYSNLVYQSLQGVDAAHIVAGNAAYLVPDIVFILLADVEILMKRIEVRGQKQEIFEQKDFLKKTLSLYEKLPAYFPQEKFIYLDASKPFAENLQDMLMYIEQSKIKL